MKPPLLLALLPALLAPPSFASAGKGTASFDIQTLKARGLGADVAEFFKNEKRFAAGVNYVTLLVNGNTIGRARATFNPDGQLCIDRDLLQRARIAAPPDSADGACLDLKKLSPQSIVHVRPGREEIEFIVPHEALLVADRDTAAGYATGGTAAILNYDVMGMRSSSRSGSDNTTVQANTEVGMNFHDWTLRSRQAYYRSAGKTEFSHLEANAQTTLPEFKSVLQVGQINAAGSMFDSPPLIGAQFFPEGALQHSATQAVVVSGIAQTQARVEVRQNAALIYSTIVPPGPFSLTGLTLNNLHIDLDVTVIEDNGAQRRFTIPASSFNTGFITREKSISLAIGKPWRYGSQDNSGERAGWLAVGKAEMPLGSRASAALGILTSPIYHAAGVQINGAPTRGTTAGIDNVFSYVPRTAQTGIRSTVTASALFSDAFSGSASYGVQSKNYRGFSDASSARDEGPQGAGRLLQNPDAAARLAPGSANTPANTPYAQTRQNSYRSQVSLGLNYRDDLVGSLGVSYARSRAGAGDAPSRYMLNWGRRIGAISLAAGAERSLGKYSDTLVYLNMSMPIGTGSLTTSVSQSSARRSGNVNYSDRINDYLAYSVNGSTDSSSRDLSSGGNLSIMARYAQANLAMARSGSGNQFYSGRLSGGIVAHGRGVTFSPYAVRDTFALLSVPGMPGVKIDTPAGPVWTDWGGMAVAASIAPYNDQRIQLVTSTLPKNADVKNGIRSTGLARGAVGQVAFDVSRTRRVLLKIVDTQQKPLTKGLSVFNQAGTWVTSIGNNGAVFMTGEQLKDTLRVANAAGNSCEIRAELPSESADVIYENAQAVCHPI